MLSALKNFFNKSKTEDLAKLIDNGAFLVDVRTRQEFAQGSAIGATNIPLDEVQSQLAKFRNRKHIIVFCRSGSRSSEAKSILEQNGFSNVTNGGTWQNAKRYANNKIK